MRGRVTACDNCRKKKVKCDGKRPCEYCSDRDIDCTFNYVPKKIAPYSKKKKRKGLVSVKCLKENLIIKTTPLVSSYDPVPDLMGDLYPSADVIPVTNNPGKVKYEEEEEEEEEAEGEQKQKWLVITSCSQPKFDGYDKFMLGECFDHSSFLINALVWTTDRLETPKILLPMKSLLTNFIGLEHKLMNAWNNSIDISRLETLPPRDVIILLVDSYIPLCFFDLPFIEDAKAIGCEYWNFKEGLSCQPKFSCGDLLLINSCLLLCCTVFNERLKIGSANENRITRQMIRKYQSSLFDNTLFYFQRISVLGDGISAVKGLVFLSFYADIHCYTQPLRSLISLAVRQAQNLGLHQAEYYRNIFGRERWSALSVWWVTYYTDQNASLKSGRPPAVDDSIVTAPPLPWAEQFCDIFGMNGPRASLQRERLHEQISLYFASILSEPTGFPSFFFIMGLDFSTIVSKVQKNLFAESQNKLPLQHLADATSLLKDLEDWKLCFPESVRPGSVTSDFIKIKEVSDESVRRLLVMSELNMDYFYLKMIISMFAVRHSEGSTRSILASQGIAAARDSLKFEGDIANRLLPVSGFTLYYAFTAFLTITAYCIQDPTHVDVSEDVQLLITSFKQVFECLSNDKHSPDKWVMVGAVSRCILFAVVNVVMDHNSDLHFDTEYLLKDIAEIQTELNDGLLKESKRLTLPIDDSPGAKFIDSISGICATSSEGSDSPIFNSAYMNKTDSETGLVDTQNIISAVGIQQQQQQPILLVKDDPEITSDATVKEFLELVKQDDPLDPGLFFDPLFQNPVNDSTSGDSILPSVDNPSDNIFVDLDIERLLRSNNF